ncbi:hypothetical protein [Polaribacter butkevichii]|uniref:Uncharacterized protein n=1 Tax=Polaribacter butkevichii TaxID=218490 RepID=A0A2P6C9Q1_9FLAO|nr:hypothetical protein [Polaribacter butkevichii]PQJ69657.1 hypothetical protein BTO14_16835 [Polaribacter butkevichii]
MKFLNFFKRKNKTTNQENQKKNNDLNSNFTVEKHTVEGKKCIVIRLKIDDNKIPILAPISNQNSEMIEYKSYRSKNLTFQSEDFFYMTPIESFIKEITFFGKYLNENGLNDNSFENALLILAERHIEKNKRIIDNDLYGLIDMALMVKTSIALSYKTQFNSEQLKGMWLYILNKTLPKIKNNLYNTKYDLSNPSQPKPYLEKFL